MTIKKNSYQLIFRSTKKLSWMIFNTYLGAVRRNNSIWLLTKSKDIIDEQKLII